MSEERLLYLTPSEKLLVESRFHIEVRLASEKELPNSKVAHPGLRNCSVRCYMNSILQMLYSNPYIRTEVMKFTVPSAHPSSCSPNVSIMAEACVKALRDLFVLLTSGDQKFYDARGVFQAMNESLVARNIANINADKIRKIAKTLKKDDLSKEISEIIEEDVTDTDRLEEIEKLLKAIKQHQDQGKKNIKRNVGKVFERVKKIVQDRSEAQQDADEFLLLILERMECYGLGRGINVNVIHKKFCVDRENTEKNIRNLSFSSETERWIRLNGTQQQTSIEALLAQTQLPEIVRDWKNEGACGEGDNYALKSIRQYSTNHLFNTLLLFNSTQAPLFVSYELEVDKKKLLLKGACLYDGDASEGHYVYADIISTRQGIIYDDENVTPVPLEYDNVNLDFCYKKKFTLSQNGVFYMYVIDEGRTTPASPRSVLTLSDTE